SQPLLAIAIDRRDVDIRIYSQLILRLVATLGGGNALSSAARSVESNLTSSAAAFARTCCRFDALKMATTPGWRSTQASAIAAGSTLFLFATILTAGLFGIEPCPSGE